MRLSLLRCVMATSVVCANVMEDTLRGLLTRTPSLIPKASILPAGATKGELVNIMTLVCYSIAKTWHTPDTPGKNLFILELHHLTLCLTSMLYQLALHNAKIYIHDRNPILLYSSPC